MDEEMSNSLRRMSTRTRKVAPKMAAALASTDNRNQAMLARLEALENDNAGLETIQVDNDDDASLDDGDDDDAYQKKQSKSTKRKTRQDKALENTKKAPRTFLELLQEANLESLPPHVPSYLRAAVGHPLHGAISAQSVGFLQIIHVSSVGCVSVQFDAKISIMTLVA